MTSRLASRWADWPLEKGKKWSNSTHVQGPPFEADLTKEHVVEAYEKIKVPAGEFDAYKISFIGKIKGKDNQGRPFSASEKAEGAKYHPELLKEFGGPAKRPGLKAFWPDRDRRSPRRGGRSGHR